VGWEGWFYVKSLRIWAVGCCDQRLKVNKTVCHAPHSKTHDKVVYFAVCLEEGAWKSLFVVR
jgi:hypothetical protein